MARALQPVVRLRIIDGARQVSAFLAIGNVRIRAGADHNALVLWFGECEQLDTANGNLTGASYDLSAICRLAIHPRPDEYPDVAGEHREAGQGQELRELTPADV